MTMRPRLRIRRGAVAVETAIVLPVFLLLLLILLIGGTLVFRFQQVACLAREGARYACVRGGDFEKDADQVPPTRAQIVDAVIAPRLIGMSLPDLTVLVQWIDRGDDTLHDWDAARKDVRSITPAGEYVTNTVRVTVTYEWTDTILAGPLTLTSVCEVPMSY